MTIFNVKSQRKQIYRSVFSLLGVVIIAFLIVLVVLQLQDTEIHKRDAIANDYHLAISNKSRQLLVEIKATVLWFQRYSLEHEDNKSVIEYESHVSPIKSGLSETDKLNRFRFDIETLVNDISSIQLNFADPEFISVVLYLEESHRNVQENLKKARLENISIGQVIEVSVEPLISSTHQLQRLHQHAYQNARKSLNDYQEKGRYEITALIIVLLLMGFIAIIKMLFHLRGTLSGLTKAQEDLQEREQNFSALTKNMQDGVLVSLDGKHIFANESIAKMLGYKAADELLGTSLTDVVHPDEQEKVLSRFRSRQQGDNPESQYETIFISKQGDPVFVELNAATTLWHGKSAGMVTVRNITHRTQVEKDLRQFKNTLDQTLDCVFMFYADTLKFFYVNEGGLKQVGYSHEEMLEMHPYDIKPEISELEFNAMIIPLRKGEQASLSFEALHKHKDGHVIPVELVIQYITPVGESAHFVAIVRDIRERKVAIDEIRATSQLLDGIVENVPNMIFLKRAVDLRFEFINKAGEVLLGLDRTEILHKNDYDFFPTQQADAFTLKDREVFSKQGVVDIPEEIIETGHGPRILHTRKISLCDEKGNPEYLLGISEDITDKRQVEIEIEHNRVRFEAMIQSIPDAIIYAGPDRKIQIINSAAINMFGYLEDELIGNQTMMLYASPDEFKQQGKKRFNPGGKDLNSPYEVVYKRQNGQEFIGETLGTPVRYSNGEILGYLGVIRDVSERKEVELELTKHRENLEELVQERTAEMTLALDIAERANRAKSEFLSRMSHELRTPMNAILGFGQLLEFSASKLNETQQVHVNEILGAGHHLLALINDVLDLAKIETGKLEVEIEKVDIDDLVGQCLVLITVQAKARHLQIINNIKGQSYSVQADFTRLKQALINLLSNAMKYNVEHGNIILNVDVIDNQRLRISVTDTGPGLTEEQLGLLFQPFERLEAGSNVEGAGIGLTITKNLIELMGGDIGVECAPGKGCTFWLELALYDCVETTV